MSRALLSCFVGYLITYSNKNILQKLRFQFRVVALMKFTSHPLVSQHFMKFCIVWKPLQNIKKPTVVQFHCKFFILKGRIFIKAIFIFQSVVKRFWLLSFEESLVDGATCGAYRKILFFRDIFTIFLRNWVSIVCAKYSYTYFQNVSLRKELVRW